MDYEHDQLHDSQLNLEAELTDVSRSFLRETAKWAKFLSIVGFVMVGLMVLGGLGMSAFMSSMGPSMSSEMGPFAAMGGGFFGLIYLIIAAIYFFPTYYLFRFATKTRAALDAYDTDGLTFGLENLKSCFKFMGIFMAVVLGIYALFFVFAIFGGIGSMFF